MCHATPEALGTPWDPALASSGYGLIKPWCCFPVQLLLWSPWAEAASVPGTGKLTGRWAVTGPCWHTSAMTAPPLTPLPWPPVSNHARSPGWFSTSVSTTCLPEGWASPLPIWDTWPVTFRPLLSCGPDRLPVALRPTSHMRVRPALPAGVTSFLLWAQVLFS